jgi:hypothetical protein
MQSLFPHQAYREGETLVVPTGASLPPFCVRCGAPAVPGGSLTSFGWKIGLAVRRSVSFVMPLCEAHRRLRRRLLWAGILLLVGCLPAAIFLEQVLPGVGDWSLPLFFVLLVAGLVVISPARQFLRPTYIEEGRAEFKGASKSFLAHLPSAP